jgi:hypothetical protein
MEGGWASAGLSVLAAARAARTSIDALLLPFSRSRSGSRAPLSSTTSRYLMSLAMRPSAHTACGEKIGECVHNEVHIIDGRGNRAERYLATYLLSDVIVILRQVQELHNAGHQASIDCFQDHTNLILVVGKQFAEPLDGGLQRR